MSTLKANFTSNLNVSIDDARALFTVNDSLNQLLSQVFTNGTGDNQSNKLYSLQTTVTGGGLTLNLFNFGGAKDSLGQTYALTAIRLLIIQSFSDNNLIVSINGVGNAWQYFFAGFGDGAFRISARGTFIVVAPTSVGYSVNGGNNSINIADEFSGSTTFNVIVLGYQ